MIGEFLTNRNLVAGLVLVAAAAGGCAIAEQSKPVQTTQAETTAPDYTRDLRPPLSCAVEKPAEWSPVKDLYGAQRRAATIGVDVILGVSKEQVFNGEFGEAKCGQKLTKEDRDRPVTVSGKGDVCMVASVAADRQPDGSYTQSSEFIQAVCAAPASPTGTAPTATSFPRSTQPKISCDPFELDKWPAIPPQDVQELGERLGVSQDRARNGKFGNVICFQAMDPAADRLRPVNAVGYSKDCMLIDIRREPSSTPDSFRQVTVVACAEPA